MTKTIDKVKIIRERCKGCGLCPAVCPVNIIKISDKVNNLGYHPAEITDQHKCISCGRCAIICPDLAARVAKMEKDDQE